VSEPDPRKSVFINCPFDTQYEPLFDALLLAIVSCGFIPRCAIESGDVAVSRMERIFVALQSSAYSIHDLSRCQGEGEHLLARFNMPLELGIAMTRRRVQSNGGASHDWLVLVPNDAPYGRFISDLAGFDLKTYDGREETLVQRVMGWLVTRDGAVAGVSPQPLLRKLARFREQKAKLKAEWSEIPWPHMLQAAVEAIREPSQPSPADPAENAG
jgi:hypothetical protein